MEITLLPEYPIAQGSWRKDTAIEKEFPPFDRAEARLASESGRPREMLKQLVKQGAALQGGRPLIVSGALIYSVCNAWIGPLLGYSLPENLNLAFRRVFVTDRIMRARCTLREPYLEDGVAKARLDLEVFAGKASRPACTGWIVIRRRAPRTEVPTLI